MANDEETVGVFTRAAASYGRVGPDLFGHFASRLVRLLDVTPGCSVLDVACGTGAVLAEASRAVGLAGRAIGVDLTPAMVAQSGVGLTRNNVAVMDAHALGLVTETFDAVACNFALTYFTDPQRALVECRRVLRPRGRFGLVVHDGWWWHGDDRWAWHEQLLAEFGDSRAAVARRFVDPEAVLAVVEHAGFTSAVATVEPFDLEWPDASHWWNWCWSHGYRVVLEQFDAATLSEFRSACFVHLQGGPIKGTLPVICAIADKPA